MARKRVNENLEAIGSAALEWVKADDAVDVYLDGLSMEDIDKLNAGAHIHPERESLLASLRGRAEQRLSSVKAAMRDYAREQRKRA